MKVYGLVGRTLQHSFSANFFSDYFANENIVARYQNFEIEAVEHIQSVFDLNPAGLNVTIPYKESVLPYVDELDPLARTIGAVNTIVFDGNHKIGYNTDVFGFQQSIKPFLTNQHERAIIFGTGGAAKAVAFVLQEIGIDVLYVSRKASGIPKHFDYSAVNSHMINACKLIINCTPVGTHPHIDECLDLPYESMGIEHLAIDLIYNPIETLFLKKAKAQGASIMNGESMLKTQAMKSWALWNP
jgi:shikimate dehydrogenase